MLKLTNYKLYQRRYRRQRETTEDEGEEEGGGIGDSVTKFS